MRLELSRCVTEHSRRLAQRRSVSSLFHEGAVTRARFSPDGRWVATASRDSTVRLWHVGTQREVLNLKHDGDVNDVAFSPDGRYLVSGSRDRRARLWEVATGQLVGSPFWHSETVAEAAFSPDGRTILTGSKHLARIWNFGLEGPKVSQLKVGGSVALSAVSADGSRLITVSDKDDRDRRSVKLWQTASGRCLAALLLENAGRVPCAAINADGSSVAVTSYNPGSRALTLQVTSRSLRPMDLRRRAGLSPSATPRVTPAKQPF